MICNIFYRDVGIRSQSIIVLTVPTSVHRATSGLKMPCSLDMTSETGRQRMGKTLISSARDPGDIRLWLAQVP